jgi:uncharacterized protein YhfF
MDDDRTPGRWGFAEPGLLRDELTALALAGAKTTTASLAREFEADGSSLPRVGQRDLLINSGEKPVAVVETLEVRVVRLAEVDDRHAIDEGEGYASAAEFRTAHERYWNSYIDKLRLQLSDPDFALNDDTLVVLERFKIVERLPDATRAEVDA